MFRIDKNISDYRPEHEGGLIVYVNDRINCKRKYDPECEQIEYEWLKFFPTDSKRWIIYVISVLFCYAFMHVCLLMPCGHLLGKG